MTPGRVSGLAWGAVIGSGAAASTGGIGVQLAFAAAAIGGLGMAHGASDLALVPRRRAWAFLAAYGGVIAASILWWTIAPVSALVGFLLLSAIHFAVEDASGDQPVERLVRGAVLIAGPALLHRAALGALLTAVCDSSAGGAAIATVLFASAILAMGALPFVLWTLRRRDPPACGWLVGGVVLLVILPPLIGFALGFAVLHARPQTRERIAALGCSGLGDYLRRTGPVLAAAIGVIAVVAYVIGTRDPTGARTLFAAIASLALPHMLVTPFYVRPSGQTLKRNSITSPSWTT